MATNKSFKLASRPQGLPTKENWTFEESEAPVADTLSEDQVLLRTIYISLDPAMRGWMNDARSYIPPVKIGAVMRAGTISQVIASRNAGFKEGDYVSGSQGVQLFAVSSGKDLSKLDPALSDLPRYLSVLGMPGMTAYFGLLDIGKPVEGENVVVSGAAGAVGQVVGQIAKIKGCNVLGIAGGADKCQHVVDTLGFDSAVDYKSQNVAKEIKRQFRKGLDVYFDNVGGDILEAALFNLKRHARIVICGAISQYNTTEAVRGPANYLSLLVNRARMEGMVVFDYLDRYPEAQREMAGWLKDGRLKSFEDVRSGIENFPDVFLELFRGGNTGKLILRVGEE